MALRQRTKIAYGLPSLALSGAALVYYVYVQKFYSDIVGLSLMTIGPLILLSRLFDAVVDPLVGSLSDRTSRAFGRRKPWIAWGIVPLCLSFLMLCAPPAALSAELTALWFALSSALFFLTMTIVSVPYEALAPELSHDYAERSKLIGYREIMQLLGTVLVGILVYWFAASSAAGELGRREFFSLGLLYALLMFFSTLPLLFLISERDDYIRRAKKVSGKLWAFGAEIFRTNKPFRILIVSFALQGFGAALPATLILFYVERVLHSANGAAFLLLYLGVGALTLPLWVILGKRYEKRSLYLAAMFINSGVFFGALFLGAGDEWLYLMIVVISGVGLGGTVVLPASMLADVTDVEELGGGQRREGELSGLWSLARKLPAALGAGLGLWLLGSSGYVSQGPLDRGAVSMLAFLYAGVPCICNVLAIVAIWPYAVGREEHASIRAQIEQQQSSKPQ